MIADPASDAHVRIAIVGGGATGVELAAELYNAAAGLRHYGLEVFDESRLEITLIEAGPRILPALPEKLAKAAHEELEALGVRVLTGARVAEVTGAGVVTAGGETVSADLRVWAAGVKGADFLRDIGALETNANNQLVVQRTLQTTRDARIFALGDCAACPMENGKLVPPRAQFLVSLLVARKLNEPEVNAVLLVETILVLFVIGLDTNRADDALGLPLLLAHVVVDDVFLNFAPIFPQGGAAGAQVREELGPVVVELLALNVSDSTIEARRSPAGRPGSSGYGVRRACRRDAPIPSGSPSSPGWLRRGGEQEARR
jgi:NADPH-dependent 2,4-dienoyl-CoA reductase/sulfur reductase-like enzyme